MSLRKPTCLTPQRLETQRRNAQQSTGPRSEAGKARMKMNALKHGLEAAPENEPAVMRALGEDPEKFAALKRELAAAFGPGDALAARQVDDLARLYWRRNRLERMETGLMREALEGVEEGRRQLARALADVTFEPSHYKAVEFNLPQPTHPCVRLRLLISFWGVIREQVRHRIFVYEQQRLMEVYYPGGLGWRPKQIGFLLGLFGSPRFLEPHDEARLQQYAKARYGGEAGVAALQQELLRLVEEQLAAEEAAFAAEMAAQERKDAIARDACLAPEDETASMVLRLEMALDRAIDRKVRILMALRKDRQREPSGAPLVGARSGRALGPPPGDEAKDRAAVASGVAPNFSSAHAGLKASATKAHAGVQASGTAAGTESQIQENAAQTLKSPEQSQNVIENKGPAAAEVSA